MSAETLRVPQIAEIREAARRIEGIAVRTPLVRLELPGDNRRILLKLENLQPIGAFKIRGAANAILSASRDAISRGVYTASAGNMALGVAYCARRLGVPCTVIVPDRAPRMKTDALERMDAKVIRVTFDRWWQTMVEHRYEGIDGFFVHPFEDPAVIAGNATMGLEIVEDAPDVDAIVAPWGGGGSTCGVASAMRALGGATLVYPVEVETATPLTKSFDIGAPATIEPKPSFVDGMGGKSVFPRMWSLARELSVQRPFVLSVAEIASAVKLLVERVKVVAEGAGAATVAAAQRELMDARTIVCVVSGGNLETSRLEAILRGEIP